MVVLAFLMLAAALPLAGAQGATVPHEQWRGPGLERARFGRLGEPTNRNGPGRRTATATGRDPHGHGADSRVRRGELDHGRVRALYRRVAHGTFRASQDAAVATAAHDVLVGLGRDPVPALPDNVIDRLDTLYADFLATIPDGPAKEDGIAVGEAAAAAILAERDDDGRYVPFTFTEGTERGGVATHDERSDRPLRLHGLCPSLRAGEQFAVPNRWAEAAQEPCLYAGVQGGEEDRLYHFRRTPGQQALADFYTVSPVELFNRAFRGLTEERGLTLAKEARLFAMLNVAGADALINCWNDKEHFSLLAADHRNSGRRRRREPED